MSTTDDENILIFDSMSDIDDDTDDVYYLDEEEIEVLEEHQYNNVVDDGNAFNNLLNLMSKNNVEQVQKFQHFWTKKANNILKLYEPVFPTFPIIYRLKKQRFRYIVPVTSGSQDAPENKLSPLFTHNIIPDLSNSLAAIMSKHVNHVECIISDTNKNTFCQLRLTRDEAKKFPLIGFLNVVDFFRLDYFKTFDLEEYFDAIDNLKVDDNVNVFFTHAKKAIKGQVHEVHEDYLIINCSKMQLQFFFQFQNIFIIYPSTFPKQQQISKIDFMNSTIFFACENNTMFAKALSFIIWNTEELLLLGDTVEYNSLLHQDASPKVLEYVFGSKKKKKSTKKTTLKIKNSDNKFIPKWLKGIRASTVRFENEFTKTIYARKIGDKNILLKTLNNLKLKSSTEFKPKLYADDEKPSKSKYYFYIEHLLSKKTPVKADRKTTLIAFQKHHLVPSKKIGFTIYPDVFNAYNITEPNEESNDKFAIGDTITVNSKKPNQPTKIQHFKADLDAPSHSFIPPVRKQRVVIERNYDELEGDQEFDEEEVIEEFGMGGISMNDENIDIDHLWVDDYDKDIIEIAKISSALGISLNKKQKGYINEMLRGAEKAVEENKFNLMDYKILYTATYSLLFTITSFPDNISKFNLKYVEEFLKQDMKAKPINEEPTIIQFMQTAVLETDIIVQTQGLFNGQSIKKDTFGKGIRALVKSILFGTKDVKANPIFTKQLEFARARLNNMNVQPKELNYPFPYKYSHEYMSRSNLQLNDERFRDESDIPVTMLSGFSVHANDALSPQNMEALQNILFDDNAFSQEKSNEMKDFEPYTIFVKEHKVIDCNIIVQCITDVVCRVISMIVNAAKFTKSEILGKDLEQLLGNMSVLSPNLELLKEILHDVSNRNIQNLRLPSKQIKTMPKVECGTALIYYMFTIVNKCEQDLLKKYLIDQIKKKMELTVLPLEKVRGSYEILRETYKKKLMDGYAGITDAQTRYVAKMLVDNNLVTKEQILKL
jgi:hypothetical protein